MKLKISKANKGESEKDIKEQIKDYLALCGIFSFPLLQGLGSYKGAPDRVLHYKQRVIYLEIKKPSGQLSEDQEAFKEQCRADGVIYWVAHSIEELDHLLSLGR